MFSHIIKFNRYGDICRCEFYYYYCSFHLIRAFCSGFFFLSLELYYFFSLSQHYLNESKFAMCSSIQYIYTIHTTVPDCILNCGSVSYSAYARHSHASHILKYISIVRTRVGTYLIFFSITWKSLFQYYIWETLAHINNVYAYMYLNRFYWQKNWSESSLLFSYTRIPEMFIGKYDENVWCYYYYCTLS